MRRSLTLLNLLFLFGQSILCGQEEPKRWAVTYAKDPDFGKFEPYSLIVLANEVSSIVKRLKDSNKIALGYLSLAEIAKSNAYFSEAEQKRLLLEENKNWPGSYVIDIRKPEWVALVIEEMIPQVLFHRFNGLFLDTLDNAIHLEEKEPEKYKGMREAAINLVKGIRHHYPGIILMLNRAYDILPEVAALINIELGESVYTTYDFANKKYVVVPSEEYQHQVEILQKAKEVNKELEVYTLDYWNPDDSEMIRKIYEAERGNKFIPYVSTIELQDVIAEPQ